MSDDFGVFMESFESVDRLGAGLEVVVIYPDGTRERFASEVSYRPDGPLDGVQVSGSIEEDGS